MSRKVLIPGGNSGIGYEPELAQTSGDYFIRRKRNAGSAASLAARLWGLSETATAGI